LIVPLTFQILSSNVRKLGLENGELLNFAISDRTGCAIMKIPKYESGLENYYEARIVHSDAERGF